MGYTHYWERTKEFDRDRFRLVVEDFGRMVPVLEHLGVRLAGGIGEGDPVIDDDEILFNGLAKCGHARRNLGIAWPSANARGIASDSARDDDDDGAFLRRWLAGALVNERTCDGDCSHETFFLPRELDPNTHRKAVPVAGGRYFDFCKTAFKPYDLAVNACLIIAEHHLKNAIEVKSDGTIDQWRDAMSLCQHFLGYGEDFKLTPK